MRREHYLRESRSRAMPRELIVFDTETKRRFINLYDTVQELVFGYAAYVHRNRHGNWSTPKWFRFTRAEELWQWVEETCVRKRRTYMYCHNANFDWQSTLMVRNLPALGWSIATAIIEDPPNYFLWKKDSKTLALLDSTNYWPESLASLGKRVGLEKLEMPGDWSDHELSDTYCMRDCEILLRALQQWFEFLAVNDFGSIAISQAGQAWTAYRHRFMDHQIFIDDNSKALALARNAYMGGRTEAWQVNTPLFDVHVLDVNQMYPHVMRENDYPTKLMSVYKHVDLHELDTWTTDYCAIAKVFIDTDQPIYPQRTDFGIVFPVGRFWTTLATPELRVGIERGHIKRCERAAVYEKAPLFRRWVNELHKLRYEAIARGDLAEADRLKKLANSLYGKFGQRGGHEEIIGECDDSSMHVETELDMETGKRYRVRYIAGVIMARSLDDETRDSHPAIAAHVTSHARVLLWSLAERAGIEHVFYMDTDSLHLSAPGRERLASLVHPTRLGALKVEREVLEACYRGAKDYTLDGATKIKGIRKAAVQLSYDTYQQDQWVSMRGACQIGHTGGPMIRSVWKTLSRNYRKGVVSSAGRISPLVRDESDAIALDDLD